MKIISYLMILIIMVLLVVFDLKNMSVTTSYFLFNDTLKEALLPLLITVAFFVGIVVGAIYNVIYIIDTKKRNLIQDKRSEKFSIDKDSAELKIQTLEAKISTLETALEKALKG